MPQGAREQDIKTHYINLLAPNIEFEVKFLPRISKQEKTSLADLRQIVKEDLQSFIDEADITVISEATWFQAIYKNCKPAQILGYKLTDSKNNVLFFAPNPFSLLYDTTIPNKIMQVMTAVNNTILGSYTEPGKDIIHTAHYCKDPMEVMIELDKLTKYPVLTCDIETKSLCHIDAGLVSIAFAWNKHEGSALYINNDKGLFPILKDFFKEYRGKLIFHNISYDVYVLIYDLFMEDPLDYEGLLEGLQVFLTEHEWEDTKLITYLATNSADGNTLGLKPNTQEYSGNYAIEEIADIDSIDVDRLLKYNLIDVLSTWYLYEKYYDKMVQDKQDDIYYRLFQPAVKDLIQMQLVGMPLDMNQVKKTKAELQADSDKAINTMMNLTIVKDFERKLNEDWVTMKNSVLKKKKVSFADAHEVFNPRSAIQLRELLYKVLKLPVLKKTKKGGEAVDGETFKDLLPHTAEGSEPRILLESLIAYKEVDKILSSFIPAFEKATPCKGWHYLYGHFNLGGTVSGRLSSSDPNLQNLPATGSKYAHAIKECFRAPKGWLMIGIDFASLEDRISALTTKDPEKLKVYQHGYDGHCLRAFSYFSNQMPDIKEAYNKASTEEEKVKVINSIKKRYKSLRQESKGYTFALTYQCIAKTLEVKFGCSKEKAERIYNAFHKLYHMSDEWVMSKMQTAFTDGYVECAFGLRLRTPKMAKSLQSDIKTNFSVGEEFRTAANALGQSYGLLNTRSGIAFNNSVRYNLDKKIKLGIRPICQIHDAQYFMIKDDPDVFLYCNEGLVKEDSWQKLDEIKHPDVHLGGELSIFYPSWGEELVVPNHISKEDLLKLVDDYLKTL